MKEIIEKSRSAREEELLAELQRVNDQKYNA